MKKKTVVTKQYRPKLFYSVLILCSVGLPLLVLEMGVRAIVPEQTFWLTSAIYAASEDADVSYTFKPNYQGMAFGVDLHTNEWGFRDKNWSLQKPDNTFRIALLGDSHAAGYGVPSQQSVGSRLDALLNQHDETEQQYEVMNFAVPAYNSHQQLAILKRYVLPYKPDLIIVIPCNNDADPTPVVDAQGWLHGGWQQPSLENRVADHSLAYFKNNIKSGLFEHSKAAFYIKLLLKQAEFAHQTQVQRPAQVEQHSTAWMQKLVLQDTNNLPAQLIAEVYTPLLAIIQLSQQQHIPVIMASFNGDETYRQLFAYLVAKTDIAYIELLALFPEAGSWQALVEQFGLGWDSHLNAAAHQRWATALQSMVKEIQDQHNTPLPTLLLTQRRVGSAEVGYVSIP